MVVQTASCTRHWVLEPSWGKDLPSHSEPPVFGCYIDRNVMPDSSTVTLLHGTLAKDWDENSKVGD